MNKQIEAYWRRLAVNEYLAQYKNAGTEFRENELKGFVEGYIARRQKEYEDLKTEQECRRIKDLAGRVC